MCTQWILLLKEIQVLGLFSFCNYANPAFYDTILQL